MKRSVGSVMILGLLLGAVTFSHAVNITYTPSDLSSGRWEYAYAVFNTTLPSVDEFTVFFEYGLYANLSIDNPKANWDGIVSNPDLVLSAPVPGFYDALALAGIPRGSSEGGFRVSFDWMGTGTPGAQYFEVVNPSTYETLASGTTAVPLPSAFLLLGSGLLTLIGLKKQRKS